MYLDAIKAMDCRAIVLFSACVVYAVFGSPTPSSFGWAEFCVGTLLLAAVGLPSARDAVFGAKAEKFELWRVAGRIYMLYGLCVPVIVALMAGYGALDILRDVVPFLFLFLPLFLVRLFEQHPKNFLFLLWGIIVIGLIFSFRSLSIRNQEDFLYLENMPTVLFVALYLIGAGLIRLKQGFRFNNCVVAIVLLSASLLPIAAMVAVHQRASIGAVGIFIVISMIYFFVKAPKQAVFVAILIAILLMFFGISFLHVSQILSDKTQAVGMNMRPQEMVAVWNVVSRDMITFLFGIGWGGHFHSPAVGGVSVNFTHNFFSSILLKSGICGVILGMGYVLGLVQKLSRFISLSPVVGMAISAPILIDLTLYASFKSLDFGLMLLMIPSALLYFGNSRTES